MKIKIKTPQVYGSVREQANHVAPSVARPLVDEVNRDLLAGDEAGHAVDEAGDSVFEIAGGDASVVGGQQHVLQVP